MFIGDLRELEEQEEVRKDVIKRLTNQVREVLKVKLKN